MPLISDAFQNNKLKKNSINIKTKYIVGNKILERNTDDSHNDNIEKGIICKKEYFATGKLKHIENKFDSRIEYTYISKDEETEYSCPNCGATSKLKDFKDGCPYCGTHYNMDYNEKDLGAKYHYDRVLKSTKYRVITAIIDIIISILISLVFILITSRTFNSYDFSKVFIYGGILSLVLYYFFYIADAYAILGPIKKYKDKQNEKQIKFWSETGIDKKTFFNNFNYEIKNKFYNTNDIIDYDIIDFDEFSSYTKDNTLYVNVKPYIRIILYKNGKFISKFINETYTFKQNAETLELKDGVNIIKCNNCGASIDATKGYCNYCNTKVNNLSKWILVK